MTLTDDKRQKHLVREQFTRTAEVFGDFAVATRAGDAEHLARVVGAKSADCAVDLACGPGTLALRFARHVRWICGLDLTPAILARARRSAEAEALANLDFALGDAHALPFADGALDIAVTSYSLHHMPDPARVIGEMARVVKRGGRIGVIDIRASEDPQVAAMSNRIERLRDASHTRSLPKSEFEAIFAAHGLRILAEETREHDRAFRHWMLVAGWKPGDRVFDDTRGLLESTIAEDSAGFHPRLVAADPDEGGEAREIQLTNTVLFLAGEKV
jgi:ubiquinone/menaquinone biosynthesis C-methylase UbiE